MARKTWPNALNRQLVKSQVGVYFASKIKYGFFSVGVYFLSKNKWGLFRVFFRNQLACSIVQFPCSIFFTENCNLGWSF